MLILIVGLVIFLGMHLTRLFAENWRAHVLAERGEKAWKGLYTIVSLIGLVLIVYGYGQARLTQAWLWHPPAFLVPVNWLLTLLAFVLVAASRVPNNPIRAALGHPMVLGVKVWAFAHLLVNGGLADLLLFGSFFIWAIVLYAGSRRRDRRDGTQITSTGGVNSVAICVVTGLVVWFLFAAFAHKWLIGVSPVG